ncbi:MAG TPA: metal ABC transporter permease [Syntrophales bacterium]|nr:metal ABC transporter permease [Syntrophales bacterium]HOL59303.1 metal ABC transporter permease [Syntrophales bacterium]HPO35504.1 metal ABC transporter permease [Syntrophales bacterium]
MAQFFLDLKVHAFLQYALWTAVLVSIPCGIVGSYIVTRRISYIAGGIAHTVLGGLGIARYLERVYHIEWLNPIYGAIVAAIIAALVIGLTSIKAKEREDTVISAIWAIGMAIGILFIARTPGSSEDLMSYLFGSILMVSANDLVLIVILDVVIILLSFLLYHQFFALSFDEEFTRLRGVNVAFYHLLFIGLTALTVVLLVTVVGIVMAIALLTLPVAISGIFTRRLWQLMVLSAFLTMIFTIGGLVLSYGPDLPAGAITIVITGLAYFLALFWSTRRGRRTSL